MIPELIRAFLLIFIAEMGDKTQILAMAFATQFKARSVLLGIFAGVLANHGIAVLIGSYLSELIPIRTVQIIAGFCFIAFGLWTLKPEKEEEEEAKKRKKNLGPFLTVATAFFIGELGDKTQLTTITLAADSQFPLIVLMGTVSAMMLTSGLGICVGCKIGNKIPKPAIKITAAAIFLILGFFKLYTHLLLS